jgi:hypothetical protein
MSPPLGAETRSQILQQNLCENQNPCYDSSQVARPRGVPRNRTAAALKKGSKRDENQRKPLKRLKSRKQKIWIFLPSAWIFLPQGFENASIGLEDASPPCAR